MTKLGLRVTPHATNWEYDDGLLHVFLPDAAIPPAVEESHDILSCWFVQVETWSVPGAGEVTLPSRLRVDTSVQMCHRQSCTGGVPPPPDIRTVLNQPLKLAVRKGSAPASFWALPQPSRPTEVASLAAELERAMTERPMTAFVVHLYWVQDLRPGTPAHGLHEHVIAIPVDGEVLP